VDATIRLRKDSSESEEEFLTPDPDAAPATKAERRAQRETDLAAKHWNESTPYRYSSSDPRTLLVVGLTKCN
jgi:hypothetical protein